MKEKECGKCHKIKAIEEFNITGRGKWKGKKRHSWCKQCIKEYDRQRWKAGIKKPFNDKRRAEIYRKLYEYLQEHPCIDCGETNILTLEFDHIKQKTYNVSDMPGITSWEKILKEIEKCEVVCANCHRIRTANRGGWRKLTFLMKD